MTLIRGTGSMCPCPTCLIPKDQLSDLSVIVTKRTTSAMKEIYDHAKANLNKTQQDERFKEFGLRGVQVSQLGIKILWQF